LRMPSGRPGRATDVCVRRIAGRATA
jgi:hypothetical protein